MDLSLSNEKFSLMNSILDKELDNLKKIGKNSPFAQETPPAGICSNLIVKNLKSFFRKPTKIPKTAISFSTSSYNNF